MEMKFALKKFRYDSEYDKEKNICQKGRNIVEGINKQEVVSVPKEHKKKGFFEKLFHFFK